MQFRRSKHTGGKVKIKRTEFIVLFIFVFALILEGCKGQATASPLSAKLSELQGTVNIKAASQQNFSAATANSILEENGQVQTGDDGRVRLDLSTGTIIRMAPSSLFTLVSNQPADNSLATHLKLQLGQIFIILKGGSMQVDTPSGVASVRGSYMMVEVDPTTLDVIVTCLEGDCSASNPAGTVNFSDGQKTVLFHRDPATGLYTAPGVEPMSEEDFQDWLNNNPEAKAIFEQAIGTLTAMPPSPTASPTATEEIPTATEAVTATPSSTTGGSTACVNIINPPIGTDVNANGRVKFEWSAQPGATSYIVTFTYPNGTQATFETTNTNLTRFMESMPKAGTYSWEVTALGSTGGEICTSQSASFSKPAPVPTRHKEEEPQVTTTPDCELNPYDPACQSY